LVGFARAIDTSIYIMGVSNSQPRTLSESKQVSDKRVPHQLLSPRSKLPLPPENLPSFLDMPSVSQVEEHQALPAEILSEKGERVQFDQAFQTSDHVTSLESNPETQFYTTVIIQVTASFLFITLQFLRKYQISILNFRVGLVFGRIPPECLLLSTALMVLGVRDLIKGIAALTHGKSERIEEENLQM
jgi:hypothetical protein